MKNCKWDTHGNLISYETDGGSTITDYKQLAKSMGLYKEPEYKSCAGGGDCGCSLITAIILISVFFAMLAGIFAVLIYCFIKFGTAFRITACIIVVLSIIISIIIYSNKKAKKYTDAYRKKMGYRRKK